MSLITSDINNNTPSKVELALQKSRHYRSAYRSVDCFNELIALTQEKLDQLEKNERALESEDLLGLRDDAAENYKTFIRDYTKLRDDALTIIREYTDEASPPLQFNK